MQGPPQPPPSLRADAVAYLAARGIVGEKVESARVLDPGYGQVIVRFNNAVWLLHFQRGNPASHWRYEALNCLSRCGPARPNLAG